VPLPRIEASAHEHLQRGNTIVRAEDAGAGHAEGLLLATEVRMPKLGMTMEEGTVQVWFKREGDPVQKGEPLLSVLTDKIDIEVDAPASGILRKILVPAGQTVPINTPIAIIAAAGEIVPADNAGTGPAETFPAGTDPTGEAARRAGEVAPQGKV